MELINVSTQETEKAMSIINMAKKHLKEQGINQWQTGYPDIKCMQNDIANNKGYFIVENGEIYGYLCIDFDGEPAYDSLRGNWCADENYVVVHRMAFCDNARGKKFTSAVFRKVEEMSEKKNVHYFRVDTDADNLKMRHVLNKNGFKYCGKVYFDNSEKLAFDKKF